MPVKNTYGKSPSYPLKLTKRLLTGGYIYIQDLSDIALMYEITHPCSKLVDDWWNPSDILFCDIFNILGHFFITACTKYGLWCIQNWKKPFSWQVGNTATYIGPKCRLLWTIYIKVLVNDIQASALPFVKIWFPEESTIISMYRWVHRDNNTSTSTSRYITSTPFALRGLYY